MTLVQLEYVITVAGQNSLNDAAKMLFISQPSLSSAIRSLEGNRVRHIYKVENRDHTNNKRHRIYRVCKIRDGAV